MQKPVTDDQIEAAEQELIGALQQTQHGNILMVEGKALTRELVEGRQRLKGAQLQVARSASDGLEMVARERFDLILLDHDLAGMDCADFCEKAHDRHPESSIIIYGAGVFGETRADQLRRYTDSIIQQAPTAAERLFKDIDRFLSRTEPPSKEQTEGKQVSEGEQCLARRRIMVVDDDARNLFVLSSSLEQHGAEVLNALNGRKALDLLQKEQVDLVFMDIMMPEMNGYEAIAALRSDARLKNLPVIALTAKALKEDRQKCLEAGADDYLSKPVDYEVLINMARAWIEKRA